MSSLLRPFTKALIMMLGLTLSLHAGPVSDREVAKEDIVASPSCMVVFDFLEAMKKPFSINGSKALWRFMDPQADRKKEGHSGEAAIRTLLVTKIRKIDQSAEGDLVTVLVDSEEGENEVLTFRTVARDGRRYISLPAEYDAFSPYRTPWTIRLENPHPKAR